MSWACTSRRLPRGEKRTVVCRTSPLQYSFQLVTRQALWAIQNLEKNGLNDERWFWSRDGDGYGEEREDG